MPTSSWGDVREQLVAHAESQATRRVAIEAIVALAERRRPAPLPERGGHWLEPAMNAVIAAAEGRVDHDAEHRAAALSREAEAFHVVVLGALGLGSQVASRVGPLLVTDGDVTAAQEVLFVAAVQGVYGDVLATLRPVLADALAEVPLSQVRAWCPADLDGVGTVAWLVEQVEGVATASATGSDPDGLAAAVAALRTVAIQLASAGLPGERELLERARSLRAAIESPESAGAPVAEPERRTIAAMIHQQIAELPADHRARGELIGWIAPYLTTAVADLVSQATPPAVQITVPTPGGPVPVTAAGTDLEARQEAVSRIAHSRVVPAPWTELAALVGGGMSVVVAAVLLIAGPTWGAVLFGLVAVAAVGIGIRGRARRRATDRHRQADLAELDRGLAAAEAEVGDLERARRSRIDELTGLEARFSAAVAALPLAP